MPKHGRQGEGGGRPPKYADEKILLDKILEYFAQCEEKKEMPNKAGLRLFLDISRDTYNEYKKRFPDALKRAEAFIENAWVQRLGGNSPTGAIFYLKNAFFEDYRDRTETDLTSKGEKIAGINYIVPAKPNDRKKGADA